MRSIPPHPLIKFQHGLLMLAMFAWLAGAAASTFLGEHDSIPVRSVVGMAGLIFCWSNGLYWWLILRYPSIKLENGMYVSRDEKNGNNSQFFFLFYWAVSIFASVVVVRDVIHG